MTDPITTGTKGSELPFASPVDGLEIYGWKGGKDFRSIVGSEGGLASFDHLRQIELAQAAGMVAFATKALLDAYTTGDKPLALVTNDDVDPAANNGVWRWVPGIPGWVKSADRVALLEGGFATIDSFRQDLDAYALSIEPGKNLYDPAAKVSGKYIASGTGVINPDAAWAFSGFIPVTEGKQYTVSANGSKRGGLAFYSTNAADGSGFVSDSYVSNSALPLTVTAPAGAAYVAFNVQSNTIPEPSEIQLEEGGEATDYEAHHLRRVVNAVAIRGENNPSALNARISAVETLTEVGPNLYDPSAKVSSSLISSDGSGAILASSGWAFSGFIPVDAGATYTLSANGAKRQGLQFYSTDDPSGSGAIAGSYNGSSVLPLTVTAPEGAAYIAFNVQSNTIPEPSEIQLEEGDDATPFSAFGSRRIADASVPGINERVATLESAAGIVAMLSLSSASAGRSIIEVVRNGDTIRREVNAWPTPSLTSSAVFNPKSDKVNGVEVMAMGDDAAPYRALGTTIGANHGYIRTDLTAAAHGKTSADIGSVWSSGGVQYVILGVPSANLLYMAPRSSNEAVPTGTFTHVAGATNIADFTASAATTDAWYSAITNRECKVFADGVEISDRDASLAFRDQVQFHETYDVLDRQTAIDWFIDNPGTAEVIAQGDPAFSVTLVHQFDFEGNYTIYADFIARADGIALNGIMFTQAGRMAVVGDGDVRYYVPDSLTFMHEGSSRSWQLIDTSDTSGWASRADFTPDRCEAAGMTVNRAVMLSDSYGFAVGYAPVQDAEPAVRRANTVEKALQISSTNGKIYPACIDKGDVTLSKGDSFKAIAYRNIFIRPSERTCHYVVRTNDADYLFADWHDVAAADRVPLPPDLAGRPFTVVGSRNVTVLSPSLTTGLLVEVSAAASYGYVIIKID